MSEYVNVPEFLDGDYALRVRGDKAAPDIQDGDLIVVRKTDEAGDASYCVLEAEGGVAVRKMPPEGALVTAAVKGVVVGLVRTLA